MPKISLIPYWHTTDNSIRCYLGHVTEVLCQLPPQSVHCIVTSPPYFKLRKYLYEDHEHSGWEIGREQNLADYVDNLVVAFETARQVLRDDGVFWLNLGDSYADGELLGVPWIVAFALKENGWRLRSEVIWHKPNPMPEPVTSRPTKAHEQLFMFTKSNEYFYDADAIREPSVDPLDRPGPRKPRPGIDDGGGNQGKGRVPFDGVDKNKRTVWKIPLEGTTFKHFALFPRNLVEPCILAATSEYGACVECRAPYERVTEKIEVQRPRPNDYVKRTGEEGTGNSCPNSAAGVIVNTIGWRRTCDCGPDETLDLNEGERVPCVVLDPFVGSGTALVVALKHGRNAVGIDLSEEYLRDICVPRVKGALLARPDKAGLAGYSANPLILGDDLTA